MQPSISVFRGRDLPPVKCWVGASKQQADVKFPCKPEDMNLVLCVDDPRPWLDYEVVEVSIPADSICVLKNCWVELDASTGMLNPSITACIILVEKYFELHNRAKCMITNQDVMPIKYSIDFTIENINDHIGKPWIAHFTDSFPFNDTNTKKLKGITNYNKYVLFSAQKRNYVDLTDVYEVDIPDDAIIITGVFTTSGIVVNGFNLIRRLTVESSTKPDEKSEFVVQEIDNVAN